MTATRDFYDAVGWQRKGVALVDICLSGWSVPFAKHLRFRESSACGMRSWIGSEAGRAWLHGTRAIFLAERCKRCTAVDFSLTGLPEATVALKGHQWAL